jgi:hypothetical protein
MFQALLVKKYTSKKVTYSMFMLSPRNDSAGCHSHFAGFSFPPRSLSLVPVKRNHQKILSKNTLKNPNEMEPPEQALIYLKTGETCFI